MSWRTHSESQPRPKTATQRAHMSKAAKWVKDRQVADLEMRLEILGFALSPPTSHAPGFPAQDQLSGGDAVWENDSSREGGTPRGNQMIQAAINDSRRQSIHSAAIKYIRTNGIRP